MDKDLILTEELTDNIVEKQNSVVVGVFMSLLAHKYIKKYGITRAQFMNSLNTSLDKLEGKGAEDEES